MIKRLRIFASNIKMRTKLILSSLLILLIPFVSFMAIIFTYSQEVESRAMQSSQQIYGQTKAFIEYKCELIMNTLNQIAMSNEINDILRQSSHSYAGDLALWDRDNKVLGYAIFKLKSQQVFSNVTFYMKDSLAGTSESESIKLLGRYTGMPWYKTLESGSSPYMWLPTDEMEGDGKPGVSLIRKIPDFNDLHTIISVVRMDIPITVFSQIMEKAVNSDTEMIAMLDHANRAVYATQTSQAYDLEGILGANGGGGRQNGGYGRAGHNGGTLIVFNEAIGKTGWSLLLIVPDENILSSSILFRNRMLFVFLATALLTLPLTYLIANSNTKRIKNLISAMNHIVSDDFKVLSLPYTRDEIGELTRNFNDMLARISLLMDEKYKLGRDKKSMELKALQAQINPHFLYNTLDMLNLMTLGRKNTEVNAAIHELSNFYKLSLSKGLDTVPLKNEIEHVKSYVKIQNMRYNGGIEFSISIPDELGDCRMPKLILQPIVENAIQHGIFEKEVPKGKITLSAESTGGDVVITVRDDGVGIPEDKLAHILLGMPSSDMHGYGIKNINERIMLYYGKEYGLSFESSIGVGTSVRIAFPLVFMPSDPAVQDTIQN